MCQNNDKEHVMQYFFECYEKCGFKVVPGHWPNFKSKEEVDEWININNKLCSLLFDKYYGY
jgi:hypothetical protein